MIKLFCILRLIILEGNLTYSRLGSGSFDYSGFSLFSGSGEYEVVFII